MESFILERNAVKDSGVIIDCLAMCILNKECGKGVRGGVRLGAEH